MNNALVVCKLWSPAGEGRFQSQHLFVIDMQWAAPGHGVPRSIHKPIAKAAPRCQITGVDVDRGRWARIQNGGGAIEDL